MNIFISYSHKDSNIEEQIANNLKEIAGIWHSPMLKDKWGENYEEEIIKQINESTIAILIISRDFFLSKFIMTVEFPEIMKHAKNEEIRIVPIILDIQMLENLRLLVGLQMECVRVNEDRGLNSHGILAKEIITEIAEKIGGITGDFDATKNKHLQRIFSKIFEFLEVGRINKEDIRKLGEYFDVDFENTRSSMELLEALKNASYFEVINKAFVRKTDFSNYKIAKEHSRAYQILFSASQNLNIEEEVCGIRFQLIPPGKFKEITNDRVFYIAKTPITVAQWNRIMKEEAPGDGKEKDGVTKEECDQVILELTNGNLIGDFPTKDQWTFCLALEEELGIANMSNTRNVCNSDIFGMCLIISKDKSYDAYLTEQLNASLRPILNIL